jgi:hypothetical protein
MRRMADSVTVANLPEGFDVYGGYSDGLYANMTELKARFPDKPLIAFTVDPSHDYGDCLDVETGDANPTQAPPWTEMRRKSGHPGPLTYCSESIWGVVRAAYQNQGVPEPGYIVAGYPGSPGEGGMYPPPAVGHQFKDWGPYDESVLVDYLPGIDPAPVPPPIGEDVVDITSTVDPNGAQRHTYTVSLSGQVWHYWQDTSGPDTSWHQEKLPPPLP